MRTDATLLSIRSLLALQLPHKLKSIPKRTYLRSEKEFSPETVLFLTVLPTVFELRVMLSYIWDKKKVEAKLWKTYPLDSSQCLHSSLKIEKLNKNNNMQNSYCRMNKSVYRFSLFPFSSKQTIQSKTYLFNSESESESATWIHKTTAAVSTTKRSIKKKSFQSLLSSHQMQTMRCECI